jgi:FtsP/CotA-like multicopper oxidase with cupredoxin domain
VIVAVGAWQYTRADIHTVGDLDFANPLRIPPVLEPDTDAQGRKVFDLDLQQGTSELVPGRTTETWGANGSYLGPTLRASRGDEVLVNVHNDLSDATTIHWHGMHLPADADGNPHQPIAPGDTWSPYWRIDQPAATLFYHPHPHGQTADHVYRGVAGLFLLDDADAPSGLPSDYGANDIPVILQDKRFDNSGALDTGAPMISSLGQLGDTILVNGTYAPYTEVGDARVRFRLLNASAARVYNIGLADEREFDLIATDGGLFERPARLERVQLSPGERAEIVAAFAPGEEVVLRSFEPELGTNFFEDRFAGGDDSFDLLQIRAASNLAFSPPVPDRLAPHVHLHEEDAVRTRRFELDGRSINGEKLDVSRIDLLIEAGTTEVWEVHNASGTPHNFHPHGVSFSVLDHDGNPPPPHLTGLKDTVYVRPGTAVRLLVRFGDYADPDTPYMFHCHVLEHEDRGMMGQFVVVEPGQEAGDLGHTHEGDTRR